MNKVKLRLEYKCYPMWIYDENNLMLDNDLVSELASNEEVDCLLTKIQEEFDALFIDDGKEFGFKGFRNDNDKMLFENKVQEAYLVIKSEVEKDYIIENLIDINKL